MPTRKLQTPATPVSPPTPEPEVTTGFQIILTDANRNEDRRVWVDAPNRRTHIIDGQQYEAIDIVGDLWRYAPAK